MSRVRRLLPSILFCGGLLIAAQARATEPRATLIGVEDRSLLVLLREAIGDAPAPPASLADARRRARDAAQQAEALLRSEGYYDAEVADQVTESDPPKALVKVTPGQRFHFKGGGVEWVGAVPDPAGAVAARRDLDLPKGAPGRAADVLAAEAKAIAALKAAGYADAAAEPRRVVVDHDDRSVEATFRLSAGHITHLGVVKVSGRSRTGAAFIRRLAPWRAGDIYTPAKLAKLEQRLIDAGVYDGVSVSLEAAAPDKPGVRDVLVSVDDRKPRTLELGAGYSSTQGSGFDASYRLYNRLGRADTLILSARLYDIQQKLDAEIDLPDFLRADQILKVGGGFLRDRTAAYDDLGGGVRANVERHWTKTTFVSLGATLDYASTTEKTAVNAQAIPVGETLHLVIGTLIGGFALDQSNDPLNPVRGWRLQANAQPTIITGDRQLEYVRLVGQASGYLPLDPRADTVIAARVRLGSILGGSIPDVPADRRFFAGGGGSVRGYGYQEVGPRLSDNTPEGGLSLAEISLEARRHIIGKWSAAAFVDAGAVGMGIAPTFRDDGVGAGLGVRYDLGFAPLRIDIAAPLHRRQGDAPVQIYISLGQSF